MRILELRGLSWGFIARFLECEEGEKIRKGRRDYAGDGS